MTEFSNSWGLRYSAADAQSVGRFEAAITSYLAARADTMAAVESVLQADPDMTMAVVLRGYLLRLAANPQFKPALQASIAQAQTLVDRGHANERERHHLQALSHWSADRADLALESFEKLLLDHPLDMLALRIAHYLHFYNGRGEDMRDSTARVLDAWPQAHDHFHYLQGMHAFGLEEAAEYEAAEAFGRAAVAANPRDLWATHAVSHIFQMQGRHAEGLRWLDSLKDHWEGTNNFRNHVVWHGALHHLGLGEPEKALQVYDEELTDCIADDFYLDICNNAALLWRLQFLGVDVGERWLALVDICQRHAQDQELVFASLHYLIPLAVTGDTHGATLLEALRSWAAGASEQGLVCRNVGVSLAEGILQSVHAPEKAAQILVDAQADTYLIGGSKAQRDLFRLLADDDAARAGRPDLVGAWG